MKKLLCLMLVAVMLVATLAGCGGSKEPKEDTPPEPIGQQEPVDSSQSVDSSQGEQTEDDDFRQKAEPGSTNDLRHPDDRPSATQKFRYEWSGDVQSTYDFVLDEAYDGINSWRLHPWWALTDVDCPIVPPDGYQVYALNRQDRIYPAVSFETSAIDQRGFEQYQDGLSISVADVDRTIYFKSTVASMAVDPAEIASEGWKVWVDDEFLILEGYNALAGMNLRYAYWIQKFDTGMYLVNEVLVRGEESIDLGAEFCKTVWGLDVDKLMSSEPHVMTLNDIFG